MVVLACNKGSSGEGAAPAASASAVTVAPSALPSAPPSASVPPKPHGPARGGIDGAFFRVAHELPLSDAQKAKVDDLESQVRDRDTGPRDAMKAFAGDLAAQERAGKIDASKLQPDEAALDAALKVMLDKQATALGGLHDAIDAGQRKALTAAVLATSAAHDADARAREGDGGDWIANRLQRMTTDLGLDAGQQKQVAALLAKQPSPSAMRDDTSKQLLAIVTAFQAEAFDASKALQSTLKGPHDAMDRQIAFATQMLALLKPEQRDKLAASTMRSARGGPEAAWSEGQEGHGGGGGGGGGNGGGGGE